MDEVRAHPVEPMPVFSTASMSSVPVRCASRKALPTCIEGVVWDECWACAGTGLKQRFLFGWATCTNCRGVGYVLAPALAEEGT